VEDVIELKYDTWGSYGQFAKSIAVLKNGKLVDPSEIKIFRGGKRKINIDDVEIIVEDHSSNKNTHIRAYVPRSAVLAKINESASAKKWRGFEIVYGEGEIVDEIVNEVKMKDNKRITITFVCYYYKNNDLKVLVKKREEDVQVEVIGRPRISIKQNHGRVIIAGDTYNIKDQLKMLGFKWDVIAKAWYILIADNTDVNMFVEMIKTKLNEVAEVVD